MTVEDGVEWAEFPTDVEEIKKHIRLRQRAARMIMAEITVLQQSLQQKIGPHDWLLFQAEGKREMDAAMGLGNEQKENDESNRGDPQRSA